MPRGVLPDLKFRRLLVVCLTVSSNLPDADLLYTTLAGGPLVYVLHHRGYTHTLIGALLAAGLLWCACQGWLRWRQLQATAGEKAWIGLACVTGVLLHLGMDYTNSYGVHPFWPFYDGWVYGDSVYIVEPLLWLATAPLIFLFTTRTARVLVAAALGIATLAVVASGLVATPAAIAFVALAAAMLAAGRWLAPGAALASGIGFWLGVTALFAWSGRQASAQLENLARVQFPHSHTLDRVLTPTPADPVCWDAWLVQAQAGGDVMRQARISLLPGWISVQDCRGAEPGAGTDAPVPAVGAAPGIRWRQQFSVPRGEIAGLAAGQCRVRAFMQFARVPEATWGDAGWLLRDLRFGSGRGRSFSQLRVHEPPEACDFAPVPWLPPRPELLGGQQ